MFKKLNNLLFLAILVSLMSVQISAQRTVTIEPGFGTIGTTIFGDTTATGERVDPATIYLLKKDQLYILDGEFRPDFPTTLQAEEGDGARPRIILGVPTGGSTPDQAIRPEADITLRGLYISAQDELGGMGSRVLRHEENDIRVVIDDCHLDITSQATFRVNTDGTKTFMTDCIISNSGSMASPDNGRCFDDRGNDIDTLWIENCTFYNFTSQIIRDAGGTINYAYFNHNTFVNIGGAGASDQNTLEFGAVNEVVVINNIFKDCNAFGSNDAEGAIITIKDPVDEGVTQNVMIKNNNFCWTENLITNLPDTVFAPVPYDSLSGVFVDANGDAESNISEVLAFTDGPDEPTPTMLAFWNGADPVEFDTEGYESFDFTYPTSAISYTASISAQPLGALTWFDMDIISGIEDVTTEDGLPLDYVLQNNYPNPFNPSTVISYSIPVQSDVQITIYNAIGKEVATLINQSQAPGAYSVHWNGKNNNGVSVSSGVYFYQLKAGSIVLNKKMMLMK